MLLQYKCIYDIWFHVDDLPSTHVYLRNNDFALLSEFKDCKDLFIQYFKSFSDLDNQTYTELKMICGCICKINSKEGRKGDNIKIIFTPSSNVIKSKSDNPGQVTYIDGKIKTLYDVSKSDISKYDIKKLEKIIIDLGKMNEYELNLRKDNFNQTLSTTVKLTDKKKKEIEKKQQLEIQQKKKMETYDHLIFDDDDYANQADDDEFM
eukprot:Mrub_10080.p1 GENE.Mrub_10080~~Mrub_10080.p1  ORF type:complete len:228 (-),score=34.72 Mrub_10080:21-641(-)